jgi:hypothetical protein
MVALRDTKDRLERQISTNSISGQGDSASEIATALAENLMRSGC